jgi:hypothetical protein
VRTPLNFFLAGAGFAFSRLPLGQRMDIYNQADWTEMDIEDLRAAIEGGATIQQAADLLCRADGAEEVARKCAELGIKPKLQS